MKKLLLAGISVAALFAGPAMAADLARPVYRAPVVYAPVALWTGFYAGINAGGSFGRDTVTSSANFAFPVGLANTLIANSNTLSPAGAVVGGQIGYNYQVSNWLVGVEADWEWTNQRDSYSACTPAANTALGGNGQFIFNAASGSCLTSEHKITNIGTARARGGVIVHDSLWYVTGGLAWARVKENDAFAASCPLCAAGASALTASL
jgi:outer membrane immunogenic protein